MIGRIAGEQMAAYREAARRRARESERRIAARRERAWHLAQVAASILRDESSATRIVVFGSALPDRRFHERSDLDLAVARLNALDPSIPIDLVRGEMVQGSLLAGIETEGMPVKPSGWRAAVSDEE